MTVPVRSGDYYMAYARIEPTENSFAYHSVEEALDHWASHNGRRPDTRESDEIKHKLVKRGDHLWMDDSALVGMFFWRRFCEA
jgi:hypothetical protein